ncbi:hypothetical protein [Rhizobium sp. CCGE 510]|uniref:hypothetical protein n=1 Tax=Rhizobium sp. CCGE 510 TaxID=1132836 RepID=UPI0009DA47E6|nr:hypothetical protein [Rhizobium sp. CCGE 510]
MNSFGKTFLSGVFIASVALATNVTKTFASSEKPEDVVSSQMLKCLHLPPDAPNAYSILAVAVLKDGAADLVSINFRAPPSDWEKIAAPLVASAITQCEPYSSISGRVEFAITPELVGRGPKN